MTTQTNLYLYNLYDYVLFELVTIFCCTLEDWPVYLLGYGQRFGLVEERDNLNTLNLVRMKHFSWQ